MPGDYSRFTDRPRKRFAAVLLQQGRVQLDADWNEQAALLTRRDRTQAVDTFGPCAVPRATTPGGFLVSLVAGPPLDLALGAGRAYVDGRQVEIFPDEHWSYLAQPFLPDPPPLSGLGSSALVYLDVWDREVTAVEDPELLEPALGGIDTTTRVQSVWQVRVLDTSGLDAPIDCGADLDALLPPSAGRLDSRAVQPPASTDPCVLPESGGYRGVENRLYRVEVHDGGDAAGARWKWSRDDASIVTAVEEIATAAQTTLTVARIGRDPVLRFRVDDWVELRDDHHELRGEPGVMARVTAVDEAARTLRLDRAVPAGEFDAGDPQRHTRVVRWDQSVGVDGDGLLAVTGTWTALEDGVEVQLTLDPAAPGGVFRTGDAWVFAARAADASVEVLAAAPPRAIVHRYCALAMLSGLGGGAAPTVSDCRRLWPPEVTGEGCECTLCVTAESHNDGSLTIQRALDEVRQGGGTICLGAGLYQLGETPLRLSGGGSVTLRGRGRRTVLVYGGAGAALTIDASVEVVVQDLAIVAGGGATAVAISNCFGVTVERCELVQVGGAERGTPVVGLAGTALFTTVRENMIAGAIGIAAGAGGREGPQYLLAASLVVSDNYLAVERVGIMLGRPSLLFGETRLSGNLLTGGTQGGIVAIGATAPGAALNVVGNDVFARDDAIVVGTDGARVADNDVGSAGGARGGAGIVLARGLDGSGMDRCQVIGNRILGVVGAGIAVRAHVRSGMIKQNVIEGCGGGGIVVEDDGSADVLVVENNQLLDVAPQATGADAAVVGIGMAQVAQLVVAGNALRGIGAASVQNARRAGIAVGACASVRIAGNEIVDLGPLEFVNLSIGIDVTGPFERVDVVDNVVRRSQPPAVGQGAGAAIGVRVRRVTAEPTFTAGNLLMVELGDRVLAVGGRQARALARGQEGATVRGNVLDAHGGAPALEVVAGGAVVVLENRCQTVGSATLAGGAGVAVVAGGTVIASNNTLQGPPDTPTLRMQAAQGAFTIMGNVVSGPIVVNGAALGPPWAPLNAVVA
jgi:hypothetical protein